MIPIRLHHDINLRNESFVVTVPGDIARKLKQHDKVRFIGPNDETYSAGEVIIGWFGPVQNIPASLLEEHHDPTCRTFSGLCLTLRVAHGENTWDPAETSVIKVLRSKALTKIARI